jgi:hypothetical protein
MAETNAPKNDRIGNDFREGPNPNPGGAVDTDGREPPYDGRNDGRNERTEGVERMLNGEPAPQEPMQPTSKAPPAREPGMAPDDAGESVGRRGEDVVKSEGKEDGRHDAARKGESQRPVGRSDDRDRTGVDTD